MVNNNEFMYLMPGNWFELKNINHDKTHPYDQDTFIKEIFDQVTNRSDKLNFIELTFGKKYSKSVVQDIQFHLDEKKFKMMSQILQTEKRHPIITFHGTSNLNAVNSILDNGYIIPGDKNKNNVAIKKTHGSAYGIGIYSSPFFDKAMYYTTPDNTTYAYVLINIVYLGTMKLIPPGGKFNNHNAPIKGIYDDGCNTRIVYGLEQLVSADADRVIPVAVMAINIK